MKTTIDLTGMREIEQTLKSLPLDVARRPIGFRALRAGGEPLAKAMRDGAPVEFGDLRESIDALPTLSASQSDQKGDVAPIELYVGPGANPQGMWQEFGTEDHPPQPFARPAWDQMQTQVLDLIGAQLGIEVLGAAKKAGS